MGFRLTHQRQLTMIVPPNVREINYLPIYRSLSLSEVQILPGSHLEKIGDGAFAGTEIREFLAPPSLREIGYAAFINCKSLVHAPIPKTTAVKEMCFWGTYVVQAR